MYVIGKYEGFRKEEKRGWNVENEWSLSLLTVRLLGASSSTFPKNPKIFTYKVLYFINIKKAFDQKKIYNHGNRLMKKKTTKKEGNMLYRIGI